MLELAKILRLARGAVLLGSCTIVGTGCAGETTVAATTSYPSGYSRTTVVYDYPVTYVETVPDFQYYPRTYYRGGYAYLVNGRWYYQSGGRWVVFREEPRELYRYRVYDYNRLEPPRRVRGAEYGSPRPRYYEPARPAPRPRDQYYYEQSAPPRPKQKRTRQPAPAPAPAPPRTEERYYR